MLKYLLTTYITNKYIYVIIYSLVKDSFTPHILF